jgi:predicted transposase YdaD
VDRRLAVARASPNQSGLQYAHANREAMSGWAPTEKVIVVRRLQITGENHALIGRLQNHHSRVEATDYYCDVFSVRG